MPLGDDKHKLIYDELVKALGDHYVSDDLAVTQAYTREGQAPSFMTKGKPEFIVLPGNTNDVQTIMRLASRYEFPWSVASTGFLFSTAAAVKPYWCFIDLKRMNGWEIDERNGYATVEPYVTISQLSAEAIKLGWWLPAPSDGPQFSVLADYCCAGFHSTAHRTGLASHHILGVEWVLPSGEVLGTGSLAFPGGSYCLGEGPGPDLRGILRSASGHMGAFGVITKIGVRLFPWPGPPVLPTGGVCPDKKLKLSRERFRAFLFTYPTIKDAIEAMWQVCKADIGVMVIHAPYNCVNKRVAKSNEEFWSKWQDRYWQTNIKNNVLVYLWGFASEKQADYEEKVLRQIIENTSGKLVPNEVCQQVTDVLFRNPYPARMLRFGSYTGVGAVDSVDTVLPTLEIAQTLEKHSPPLLDYDGDALIASYDLGRFAVCAATASYEKTDENDLKMWSLPLEVYSAGAADIFAPTKPSKEALLAVSIKKRLDPNNVANPSRFIDTETISVSPARY